MTFHVPLLTRLDVARVVTPGREADGVGLEALEAVDKRARCSVLGRVDEASEASVRRAWRVDGRGLCVYADPIYRAPRGTPDKAVEECRRLMAQYALRPLSICEQQFFLVDHDENHRREHIAGLALGTCGLVAAGVVAALMRPALSQPLRAYAARSLFAASRTFRAFDLL